LLLPLHIERQPVLNFHDFGTDLLKLLRFSPGLQVMPALRILATRRILVGLRKEKVLAC
jgi:hypothetical protein